MQLDPFVVPRWTRKKVYIIWGSSVSVFVLGIALLLLGFFMYREDSPAVPYMWSLTLCKVEGAEKWIGMELGVDDHCPTNLTLKDGTPQSFHIPPGVLIASVPYDPVIYVTNKVKGTVTFSHKMANQVLFSTPALLSNLEETKFALCGGMELLVFRDGPIEGAEGDYVTTDCANKATGCIYEPGRSMNKYAFDSVTVELVDIPEDGSYLMVDSIILEADLPRSPIIMPDAYIHYEVAGKGNSQQTGMFLMAFGAILADLMPATLYFLISKPHTPGNQ